MSEQPYSAFFNQHRDSGADGDEFDQWYFSVVRYYSKRVDPEVRAVYKRVLGDIPMKELQAVWDTFVESDNSHSPPKAGLLKDLWRRRKDVQRSRGDTYTRLEKSRYAEINPQIHYALTGEIPPGGVTGESESIATIRDYVRQQFDNGTPIAECYALGRQMYDGL
jgi:hypothetical protein